MKGWMVRGFGGPEVMQWEDLPDPVAGPGQVRVAVKASGVVAVFGGGDLAEKGGLLTPDNRAAARAAPMPRRSCSMRRC